MARLLCLTGAESCGKTTLARALAHSLDAVLVPELARDWLSQPEPPVQDESLLRALAEAQQLAEAKALAATGDRWVILDTDITVLAVWWMERFAGSEAYAEEQVHWPDWLRQAWRARSPRRYLLCSPDIPWAPDPLRVNPLDRPRLDQQFERLLNADEFPWRRISGAPSDRLQTAIDWLRGQDSGDSS